MIREFDDKRHGSQVNEENERKEMNDWNKLRRNSSCRPSFRALRF